MNTGVKVTVTNALYNSSMTCQIRMFDTNNNKLIYPTAIGSLRIPALNTQGFIDVDYYYSSDFSSTLLSDRDVLHSSTNPRKYKRQSLEPLYDIQEDALYENPADGTAASLDQGNCVLICEHRLCEINKIVSSRHHPIRKMLHIPSKVPFR